MQRSELFSVSYEINHLLLLVLDTVFNGHFLTEQADLWSVGVILYQLVTGIPPFNGDNQIQVFSFCFSDDASMSYLRFDY